MFQSRANSSLLMLSRRVQSALLSARFLPPPSTGSEILSGFERTGTGRASDASIAAVVQRIVGNIVLTDVGPDIIQRPIQQRIKLRQAVARIPLLNLHRVPDRRL